MSIAPGTRFGSYEVAALVGVGGMGEVYLQGNALLAVAVETEQEFSFAAPVQLFTGPHFAVPGPGVRTYDIGRDGRFS